MDSKPEIIQLMESSAPDLIRHIPDIQRRIAVLEKIWVLEITEVKQFLLLSGEVRYFSQFVDFVDNDKNNIVFYALWSESIDALEWIVETQKEFVDNYWGNDLRFSQGLASFFHEAMEVAVHLKSFNLLTFIQNQLQSTDNPQKHYLQYTFVRLVASSNWVEGLKSICAMNPGYIEAFGDIIIKASIYCLASDIFKWVKNNLKERLMNPNFFGAAIYHGMFEAVQWFLENAPNHILNYQSKHGTTAVHLAAASRSNHVFNAITTLNLDSLHQRDKAGAGIAEYALISSDVQRINTALALSDNPTELSLISTPERFVDSWNHEKFFSPYLLQALMIDNTTLQTIHFKEKFLRPAELERVDNSLEKNKLQASSIQDRNNFFHSKTDNSVASELEEYIQDKYEFGSDDEYNPADFNMPGN